MTETIQTLPFGRHKGVALSAVPSPYLSWLARETKLSSGLAAAVRNELTRRGMPGPSPVSPKPHSRLPPPGAASSALPLTFRALLLPETGGERAWASSGGR